MNILLIPEHIKLSSSKNTFGLLYKHAIEWAKENNDIYLLAVPSNMISTNSSVKQIDRPIYLPNNLFLSLWFSLVNHPRIDLIVCSFSIVPFIYPKSDVVFYLDSDLGGLKRFLTKLLIKHLYKKSYYLTSSREEFDELQSLGIKENHIYLLEKSLLSGSTKRNVKKLFSKNVLYVENSNNIDNILKVINILSLIDRRDEGWTYKLIVSSSSVNLAKEAVSKLESNTNFKLIVKIPGKNLDHEISRAGMVLDIDLTPESLKIDMKAVNNDIPVAAYKSQILDKYFGLSKALLLSDIDDPTEVSNLIINFAKNPKLIEKNKVNANLYSSQFSWKNLAAKSLNFLESI